MDFPGSELVTHKQLMPAISQTKHIASSARLEEEQGLRSTRLIAFALLWE